MQTAISHLENENLQMRGENLQLRQTLEEQKKQSEAKLGYITAAARQSENEMILLKKDVDGVLAFTPLHNKRAVCVCVCGAGGGRTVRLLGYLLVWQSVRPSAIQSTCQ